jgi:hypothetical protein
MKRLYKMKKTTGRASLSRRVASAFLICAIVFLFNTGAFALPAGSMVLYAAEDPNVAAPATLMADAVSSSQIDLVWSYADYGSYKTIIERKTGETGTWTTIKETAYGVLQYSDMGLSPDTQYFYRVRKYVSADTTSVPFPNNDTGIGARTLIAPPYLKAMAAADDSIYLYWTGNNGTADTIIEKKLSNGSFAVVATVGPDVSAWTDTSDMIWGAVYTYRAKFRTSGNESVYSDEASAANIYLKAPGSLSARAITAASSEGQGSSGAESDRIVLSWSDNSTNETGFEIWKRVYGSTAGYTLISTVGQNVTEYTDTDIKPGVQYTYMVRAFIGSTGIFSSYSNAVNAGLGVVNAPLNLRYSIVSSSEIELTWQDNSNNESGFKIERKIGDDGDWTETASLPSNSQSYKVIGLNQLYNYYFRVKAYNYSGYYEAYSNEILVSTVIPAAPTKLVLTPVSSDQVNLTWQDNSTNETGFRIMRRSALGLSFIKVAEVDKDVTSYVDRTLSPSTTYRYKIVAVNGAGMSESGVAYVTTAERVAFSDVPEGYWAKRYIENLASRGVLTGKGGNLFKPGDKVTKAEFTAMIVRAFNLDTVPVGSLKDVKVGSWYYVPVMTAENLGIVSADSSGLFYPNSYITREEMAVIIVKALQAVGKPLDGYGNSVIEKFKDKELISPHALSSVAAVVGNRVMDGVSEGFFSPGSSATRAEAAAVIYRIIDR